MPVHASQRIRNVTRTIMVGLSTLDLAGFVLLPDGDARAPGEGTTSWVRVSVLPVSATTQGRSASDVLDTREDILVSCEVYHRSTGFDASTRVDDIEAPAEALKHYFTARDLAIYDYVADPTGATPVTGHSIQFFRPPRRDRLPPSDGFERRLLAAQGTYFTKHVG